MITVPGFLLQRLYLKGSLCNGPNGFQFQMRNTLGSGYARKLMPLTVDGEEIPLEESFFITEESRLPFTAVSQENPIALTVNKTTTIEVTGRSLDGGPHRIGMGFHVVGLGELGFDFVDVVQDE